MEGIRTLARQPRFWAFGYVVWICVLYGVSSTQGIPGPKIPHLDKFEHAGYFAAGHLVLGLALTVRSSQPNSRRWLRIGVVLVIVAGLVGVLDESHQSFTPGRNGNDLGDILADITGGIIAAFLLPKAWAFLQRFTSSR
ncbi:MAG: VanZ family protein [Verrucomicrobia bacterium]|nr:VanZ family protein [Verrucomicrobiota bacterium]